MLDLRKFLFGRPGPALSPELAHAVAAWEALPAADLGLPHFHCRYVLIDVATSGPRPESDTLRALAALGLVRGGYMQPDESVVLELEGLTDAGAPAVDRALAAILSFIGKGPLVSYHAPYVAGFLERLFRERLGVDLALPTIDLAWLLPALFSEISSSPMPLDHWLQRFTVEEDGVRDVMHNALHLARLFQRALARANLRGLDTPARLLQESGASSFLRRHH